jgi:uncharacterized membrane protein (UPF0127 family)
MIKNKTRKQSLSREEKICKSLFSKFKGLMFTKKIKKPLIFVNEKEISTAIHMFFVFYEIDVAWLNEKKQVVHKQRLRPFSFSKPIKAKYIIEMPSGALDNTKIRDKLEFHA